jgi:glucan phosphoethanolaminetransferase (alkaline phosphatase superfamily)
MPNPNPNQRPRAIGIATAFMCALAGGAIWCLLALYSQGDLAAFAFVVALLVVWALRAHGYAGRWSGAFVAAACVVLAALYSFYLQAVAQIACMLGIPMRQAFSRMEPSMAIDIARANLGGVSASLIGAAVVLAAVLMLLRSRG